MTHPISNCLPEIHSHEQTKYCGSHFSGLSESFDCPVPCFSWERYKNSDLYWFPLRFLTWTFGKLKNVFISPTVAQIHLKMPPMDSAQNFRLETPDSEGSNLHGPSHVTNLCFETRFGQNLQDVWISLKNLAQLIVTHPVKIDPPKTIPFES